MEEFKLPNQEKEKSPMSKHEKFMKTLGVLAKGTLSGGAATIAVNYICREVLHMDIEPHIIMGSMAAITSLPIMDSLEKLNKKYKESNNI